MRARLAWALVLLAAPLAACDSGSTPREQEQALRGPQVTAQQELVATLPLPGETAVPVVAANVPHVYMAVQPPGGGGGATSIVFAIDRSRDNTPADDPAMRITPEDGLCNPQELQRFNFPPDTSRRPVFGPEEASRGISARDLPNFMAMMVTSEMMRRGMVVEPEQSKPQNVCTRKLWERLTVLESAGAG